MKEGEEKPKFSSSSHINVEHISARKCIKDNGCTHRYFAVRLSAYGGEWWKVEGEWEEEREIEEGKELYAGLVT